MLALPWTAWKLAGPWIVVPLVVIPISVIVSMVLCAPLTALAGEALWGAIVEAGRDHDWLVAELGPAARAGPIALVFAIPLLLVDLGAILLEPSVLLHLVLAVLALARSILLGLELLVAGDIINTVAVEPTLRSLAVLAGIVLIRTFLSVSLEVEIEGRWPWQAPRAERTPADGPRDQA